MKGLARTLMYPEAYDEWAAAQLAEYWQGGHHGPSSSGDGAISVGASLRWPYPILEQQRRAERELRHRS